MNRWQLEPTQIVLKLAGRKFVDPKNSTPFITKYRQTGHLIYIGDFGAGYPSLNYLQGLDIDILKISKSFADTLEYSNVVPRVVGVAKILKLEMVTEDIKTEDQETWLRKHGVQYGQG